MADTSFTPGPWHVINDGSAVVGDPERIVETFIASVYGTGGCGDFGTPEMLENAHLIAAAPTLYEALVDLEQAYCDVGYGMTREKRHFGRQALAKTRAALAKARGEQP